MSEEEAITSEASPSVETTAEAEPSVNITDLGDQQSEGQASPQAPAYTPNLKFKYFDPTQSKQIEKEFDKWATGVVKDQKTEKEVRDLYEKAFGLEPVKLSRDKYKTEADTLRSENRHINKLHNTLNNLLSQGDLQTFFEALKFPEDKVLQYALERIQYREMTPEQKAQFDGIRSTKARAEFLEEQNRAYEARIQETAAQHRGTELDNKLSDPNVAQVVQAFDARLGQAGAFKQEVVRRGMLHWHQYQKDIPVEQAVNEVLQIVGGVSPTSVSAPSPSPAVSEPKPVIQNIQGTGGSPAKKRPKSIADIKKLYQAM